MNPAQRVTANAFLRHNCNARQQKISEEMPK